MMKVTRPDSADRSIALYCRVSTRRQAEEGYSIEIQKERLQAYVTAKYGSGSLYEFYIDDGYSGGSLERPEVQRLIANVKNHLVTDVIVMKLDRLSRSQKDTLYLIEDVFLANNVAFSSIQESFDTSTAQGRVVVGILSVFAQFERENIYERTRAGMKKRVEEGYWPGGGGVPFGYDYDRAAGVLVPNEDAGKVKQCFDLYLQGMGTQKIADTLGLQYDKLVYQIITRKTYTGKMIYNGVEYQMRHEPLITEELYEKTQRAIKQRSYIPANPKPEYLLSGLCECGRCGARMRYQKWGKSGAKIVCYSTQGSKAYMVKDPNCDAPRLWADDVESAVIQDLFSYGQKSLEDIKEDNTSRDTLLDTLVQSRKTIDNKIKQLIKLFAIADESTEDELQGQILELQDKGSELDDRIAAERNRRNSVSEVGEIREKMKTIESLWPSMSDLEKQNFVRKTIDKVVIDGSRIRIDYNF